MKTVSALGLRFLVVSIVFLQTDWCNHAFASGGTSVIASKGQKAHVAPGWPEGVDKLVNDNSRTSGWNSWFSEWPNDVNQYAFEIDSTTELNRLLVNLAAVKSKLKCVHLSYQPEPSTLGWVTRLPEGNKIPVLFSIGDQSRIDEWYKRVRKPFGVMEFTGAPVAVPPTLTIFVRNEAVNLSELRIPAGIEVKAGAVPTVFHKSNTKLEQEREKKAEAQKAEALKALKKKLDDESLAAMQSIEQFLDSRRDNQPTKP